MANVSDIYLVMSTVAIAHEPPATKTIEMKDFEKLLPAPVTVTNAFGGLLISFQREQLEVLTGSTKTDVRDLSGKTEFATSKVGRVVEYFLTEFGLKPTSYGVNFVLRVPQSQPPKWIVDNVLSSNISKKTGKALVGGSATVSVKSGRKTWNVRFEPSDRGTIDVNFNASEKTKRVLSERGLQKELTQQWELLVQFLSDLGL